MVSAVVVSCLCNAVLAAALVLCVVVIGRMSARTARTNEVMANALVTPVGRQIERIEAEVGAGPPPMHTEPDSFDAVRSDMRIEGEPRYGMGVG